MKYRFTKRGVLKTEMMKKFLKGNILSGKFLIVKY